MINFSVDLLLIDGSFYFYRYYYGIPILKNQYGQNTNAIYGVLNLIKKLLIKYQPKKIAIIFDSKGKKNRNKIFYKYKKNRKAMPQQLVVQIKPLYKIIKLIGIPLISIKNVESDDVIGTLSLQANKINDNVLIASGDKDMIQLVNEKTKIIYNNNFVYDKNLLIDKYGFSPEFIVDFIALSGDNSDNIPGVPGIGKKTALYLLKKIGNLNTIYNNLQKIKLLSLRRKKNIYKILKENKNIAFISYKLALIDKNIKIKLDYKNLIIKYKNEIKLIKTLENYGLKSYLIDKKFHNILKNKLLF